MSKLHPRAMVLIALLFVAGAAVAATPQKRSAAPPPEAKLFWRLPIHSSSVPFNLGIRITQDDQTLFREVISIPADTQADAVVQLFSGHAAELRRLREAEAAKPGTIHVTITKGRDVLADVPFARLEALSAKLRKPADNMIGTMRFIDVNVGKRQTPGPGRIATLDFNPDPSCVQNCEDERFFCYTERCDERGSCAFCEEYYWDCYYSCPEVCTDTISYYTRDETYGTPDGLSCFRGPDSPTFDDLYQFWTVITYHYTYKRTTHCDGSYTDELVSTTITSYVCWRLYVPDGCFGASSYPPSVCPF